MNKYKQFIGFAGASIFSVGYVTTMDYHKNQYILSKESKKYTYNQIEKHNNKNNGIWVIYHNNVYDITDYIESHPGGKDKIMLAAGKGLEPYWNIYKQHLNNKDIVNQLLEPMKIGTIEDYDPNKCANITDPYINEPIRTGDLEFHSITPCNAETPINQISDNWITPNDLWYIRNHHPVPSIDEKDYRLEIVNIDNTTTPLSLNIIQKSLTKKIIATIQCGGNRRNEFNLIEKTSGLPWGKGAISNAEWEGISLGNVLFFCGLKQEDVISGKVKHVHFEGYDGVIASIPIKKALDPLGDVIIAYKMNGEDLPKDHGFPLRVIVPGHVGIRNIKWLKSIKLSDKEADGVWQSGLSYKILPNYIKSTDLTNLDIEKYYSIQEMPVQSCILESKIKEDNPDKLIVNGFAWSGGGRGIIRVDVSMDNGNNWQMAHLKEGKEQPFNQCWAWTFWEIEMDNTNKNVKLCCKATDSSNNTQFNNKNEIWNIRGLNNNSWDYSNQ
mgnify:CR=1 FL=1